MDEIKKEYLDYDGLKEYHKNMANIVNEIKEEIPSISYSEEQKALIIHY